ncbi:MAG: LA_2490 family SGNH/GDSL-type esterase [Leptonema sp. (in: bacteria)]
MKFFYYLILFLLTLEVSLRFYQVDSLNYFITNKKIHTYNNRYFVGLKPNTKEHIKHYSGKWEGTFTINSYGMRNLEEPKKDYTKILCLGDSIVMGFGVSDEETFCYLLNENFKNQNLQFLNAGIDGLGSWGIYQRYQEIMERVENIRYALFFVSPNDFSVPPLLKKQGILTDDEVEEARLINPFKKFLDASQFLITDWFYSFFYLKIFIKQAKLHWSLFKNDVQKEYHSIKQKSLTNYIVSSFLLPQKKEPCISSEEKFKIFYTLGMEYQKPSKEKEKDISCPQKIPKNIESECTDFPVSIPPLPEFTKKVYLDLVRFSKEKGVELIVVFLPLQLEEIYCNQIHRFHPLRMYALQAQKFFQENQIKTIDLMDYTNYQCIEGEYRIEDHYIPEDGHFTKLGNEWVARHLKTILEKLLYAF